MTTIVTIPSRSPTTHRGRQATTSRGKFRPFVTLCLVVLCCLCLIVANRVFNSSFGRHGKTETAAAAAAAGDFALTTEASSSTRLAENSIRSGDDDDDVGNDAGGGGAGQTMRTQIGHEGSSDAVDPTATAAAAHGDFELAAGQSHGFFYDVTSDSWNLLRDIYLKHDNHRDPSRPLLYSQHDPKFLAPSNKAAAWYQNNYEPNFSCMFEKRIGGMQMNGDGPKWVCDPHRIRKLALERKARDPNDRGCVVYSIGSNGDFNFELGIQKEIGVGICEFHVFDMGNFEGKMPKELKRAHYHRWGLKNQDPNFTPPRPRGLSKKLLHPNSKTSLSGQKFYGLLDIIKMLGHEELDVIDIFKIDCEGCEWETYMDWIAEGVPMLHQIQVEVHKVPGEVALNFFDKLEAAGYLRYHKEANIQFGSSCIEYGMVKVSTDFMNGKNFTFNKMKFTMANGRIAK